MFSRINVCKIQLNMVYEVQRERKKNFKTTTMYSFWYISQLSLRDNDVKLPKAWAKRRTFHETNQTLIWVDLD